MATMESSLPRTAVPRSVDHSPRQPGVLTLYGPKWRMARRRLTETGSFARGLILGIIGLLFWLALFGVMYRILDYFRGTPGFGEVLALKLLSTLLLAFLPILLLSNIITALSSFFLATDLELLAAAPVDGLRVYGARLLETFTHSSWMIVLMLVPVLSAYGVVFDGGLPYIGIAFATVVCFLVIPAAIGTATTQVLVNVFPARRARDILALVGLLGAAAFIAVFRLMRPEQLARPEGFRDLVDFIASLRTPQSIWLPSEWAAQAILTPLGITDRPGDLFPLLLLASTAAVLVVGGAWLHERLFLSGLSRAHEGAERDTSGKSRINADRWLAPLPITARSMVVKDIRNFFRDTTQWSQLILLAVLVVVYIYNIKVLPIFSGEDIGFMLTNVVVFLNTGLAGFVLAAIAARLVFPAISLEGRSLWLLRSSPLRMPALVWSKFWVGLIPLLALAVAITVGTNVILRVSGFMAVLSVATIVIMTFTITAMALGFGAVYPKFNSENAADVPTSFGGLLFMMTSTAFIAGIIVLEAWPVYALLQAQLHGSGIGTREIVSVAVGLGAAVVVSGILTGVSLRVAVRRIEAVEV
jgi:ABC-2 type transport system permease protein